MLFLLGIRTHADVLEEGAFHCPTCACEQPYARKFAKRWFCILLIPVMALEDVGEFVQCHVCDHTFDLSVLRQGSLDGQRRFVEEVLRGVCAALAYVAGGGQPLSREQAGDLAELVRRNFGGRGDLALLRAQLQRHFPDFEALRMAVRPAHDGLTDPSKEMLLRIAGEAYAAAHGGALSPVARENLKEVGELLGLSTAHVRGLTVELDEALAR